MATPFQVPDLDDEIEFYEFTMPGSDKVHRLPTMDYITAGQAQDLNDGNVLDVMFELSQDADTLAAVRGLRRGQLKALIVDWQANSGVTPGESSAS